MKRFLTIATVVTLSLASVQQSLARDAAQNTDLPKVDYQIGKIQPVGQGLAIPVTNRGFAMSPQTTVSVAIYNADNRQLIATKSLRVQAMRSNQTSRAIFVPPNVGHGIMVRAMVDPGNRVPESNERNNQTTSRH